MWYRIWRFLIASLICVFLMGLLLLPVGSAPSAVAQTDGCSQDDTFCIGQHPSPTVAAATAASGSAYVRAGLEFEWPGLPLAKDYDLNDREGILRSQQAWPIFRPIWPGTPDGRRAFVTIWISPNSGSAQVRWPEGTYELHPGDSITVFTTMVELGNFPIGLYFDLSGFSDEEIAMAEMYPRIMPGNIFGTYTITLDLCD